MALDFIFTKIINNENFKIDICRNRGHNGTAKKLF